MFFRRNFILLQYFKLIDNEDYDNIEKQGYPCYNSIFDVDFNDLWF